MSMGTRAAIGARTMGNFENIREAKWRRKGKAVDKRHTCPPPLPYEYVKYRMHITLTTGERILVADATPEQFDAYAVSKLRYRDDANYIFDGINRTRWDIYERWYILGELCNARTSEG